MSVRNGNRCKHPAHQIGMDLPLGQPLHGKRHTNNPNEYGVPAARAHGGGRSPDGQFGPRELLGQGRGAKQSLLLSNKPFFSSPPPSRQERCRRRRSRPHPMPAHGAVAVPWRQRGASPSGEGQRGGSTGPWGSTAWPAPATVTPRQRGRVGQVEAPGVLAQERHGAGTQVPRLAPL